MKRFQDLLKISGEGENNSVFVSEEKDLEKEKNLRNNWDSFVSFHTSKYILLIYNNDYIHMNSERNK